MKLGTNTHKHIPIEMWLENIEGFEGDGNLLGKFGLEIRDQANFVVTKRRFDSVDITTSNRHR